MSKTLSYKGSMASGATTKICLATNKGKIGYRLKKFEAIPAAPGVGSSNHIIKIYNTVQSTVTSTVDFSDSDLLGLVWLRDNSDSNFAGAIESIIFDNELFNQDIYITHAETVGSEAASYYIELEAMPISDIESTMLTLKSLRTVASR
jgi:hypothetical protein